MYNIYIMYIIYIYIYIYILYVYMYICIPMKLITQLEVFCSMNLLFLFCNCYRFISNNVSVKAYDFVAQVKSYADSLHGNVTLLK